MAVHGIRLVELTDRDSSVMKVSGSHDFSFRDPILNVFRSFGQLNNVSVLGGVVIAPEYSYAENIVNKARGFSADFLLLPWSETGSMSERQIPLLDDKSGKYSTGPHTNFVCNVLKNCRRNVGVFVNKGFGGPSLGRPQPSQLCRSISGNNVYTMDDLALAPSFEQGHHIFMPYFSGPDDEFALRLVLQLAKNPAITATIAHIDIKADGTSAEASSSTASPATEDRAQSLSVSAQREDGTAFFNAMRDSLPRELAPRVVFQTVNSSLSELVTVCIQIAKLEVCRSNDNSGNLVIVGRNSVASASDISSGEIGTEARSVLGVLGVAMVEASHGVRASVLVIQADQEGAA
ncbi:hypothetical protein VTO42DRAFT_5631 [Malbranchea cinnamomea]